MASRWIPAVAFALLQGLGIGLFASFGFFVKPVAQTYAMSEAGIAAGLSLLVLVPALIGALLGKLVDRVAMRGLLLAGVWVAALFLAALPLAQASWQLGLLFLGFVVGIIVYGPQATNVFLVRCYPVDSGRALAIGAIGVSGASIVLPPVIAALLSHFTWQQCLQLLAVGLLLILTVAIGWGVPRAAAGQGGSATALPRADFSDPVVRAALRSRAFWCVGLGFAILQALMMISSLCFVPHFMEQGLSVEVAARLVALSGGAGLVGKLSMAALADSWRHRVRGLCMLLAALQVLGWTLFWLVDGVLGLALTVMVIGFSGGASLPMFPFANSQYFPASMLGRLYGVQAAFFLPFGLLGPPLAGYAFDTTGSYLPAFAGVAVVNALGLCLFAALPPAPAPSLAGGPAPDTV